MTDLERLLSKIKADEASGCWNWTASLDTHGYGHMRFRGRLATASRISYELHRGPIPKGLHVCHRCDNPKCVNPEHLFVGTRHDNMMDKLAKGRQSRVKHLGSKNPLSRLSEADVVAIRKARGKILQKELAAKYGVDRAHISQIQSGKRWGHLA